MTPTNSVVKHRFAQAAIAFSGYLLFKRAFGVHAKRKSIRFERRRTELLDRLKAARDLHNQQSILDQLMAEDLLRGADLSRLILLNVHAEGANLQGCCLQGAALENADLEGANLEHALLAEADLAHADLMNAGLSGTDFRHANLTRAKLSNSTLAHANLQHAALQGASLYEVDLTHARLDHADLRGCCLMNADLRGASLQEAKFDQSTVMPNGDLWSPEGDISRFTNVHHVDFEPALRLPAPTIEVATGLD